VADVVESLNLVLEYIHENVDVRKRENGPK
jgi:hypothetical protein